MHQHSPAYGVAAKTSRLPPKLNHLSSKLNAISMQLFQLIVALILQFVVMGTLLAAPQLDLRQQDRTRLTVDLRPLWQTAMVPDQGLDTAQPLDAQAVWSWPDDRFAPGKAVPVTVRNGERLVGRLSMLVQDSPHSLVIELPMPRLDVAHLSYRYDGGAWVQLSAGDQIPMVQWPFASRSPAFFIPPKPGELQIVLDIPQLGLFPSPVRLWADTAFREAHANRNMETGAAMALVFFSMFICFGAAVIFKRFVFVAVGLYSMSVVLLAAGNGGIAGIYFGTTTTWFNDYIKYLTSMFFGAMVPWTISAVVAQKYYSKLVAHLANFWLIGSLAAVIAMLFMATRATQWALTSPFLIASLIFGLGIALTSVVRGQAHAYWSLAAVVLICVAIFTPIAAYWGYLDGQWSYSVTMLSFSLSSALLLFTLLLQYRHGNRVIARAAYSPGRDALTGLLNRNALEGRLVKITHDITAHSSHALFMYVAVRDAKILKEQFGGEGFESGMVQMAAALSSSISVMDTVARIAPNAFGVAVVMHHNAKQANALAQKIITRTMAISSHSVPMVQTARIAMAWMPVYGTQLGELEKRAERVVNSLDEGKRIGWVGGAQAQTLTPAASDSANDLSQLSAEPLQADMYSVINRVERSLEQEDGSMQDVRANRPMKVMEDQPPADQGRK
jgi:GGDEF domain-containing protein